MADSFSGLFGPDQSYGSTALTMAVGSTIVAKYNVPYKMYPRRVFVVLNAAPAGSTGTVLLTKRVTPGSATGETTLATLKILSTHAAGQVVYFDFTTTVTATEGDELTLTVGGSDANVTAFDAAIIYRQSPEVAANNTEMVATT